MTALRRGQGIPVGKKVLIVLDQFEQWLHAKKEEKTPSWCKPCGSAMVGGCSVSSWCGMISGWRSAGSCGSWRFGFSKARTPRLVDLFDVDHARKVLAAFGRAFGKLAGERPGNQQGAKAFLNQAVSGLAQEGKVVCVRLALFAEMMKGKAVDACFLESSGGTAGVGVTFLEETFSAATAPPGTPLSPESGHGPFCKALLPESGTDIKGHMRSYAELLEASGYGSRPRTSTT